MGVQRSFLVNRVYSSSLVLCCTYAGKRSQPSGVCEYSQTYFFLLFLIARETVYHFIASVTTTQSNLFCHFGILTIFQNLQLGLNRYKVHVAS